MSGLFSGLSRLGLTPVSRALGPCLCIRLVGTAHTSPLWATLPRGQPNHTGRPTDQYFICLWKLTTYKVDSATREYVSMKSNVSKSQSICPTGPVISWFARFLIEEHSCHKEQHENVQNCLPQRHITKSTHIDIRITLMITWLNRNGSANSSWNKQPFLLSPILLHLVPCQQLLMSAIVFKYILRPNSENVFCI